MLPGDKVYDVLTRGSGKQEIATTMAFVRLVRDLFKDPEIGKRVVPIIPDEARTFGMDSFFPTPKIYNPSGQLYTAVDANLMLAYKESEQGVILHEGIDEAGSVATLTAVSTAYATHGEPMIPMYIFYSMFGFQRTGDGLWAIGDQMGRGFVLGATAGRTTLTGEGLQHADGHSHLLAATQPHFVAYDPAYGYEIAHIVKDGLRRMYGGSEEWPHGENIMYYITLYNEPYQQPKQPEDLDVDGLLKGMYKLSPAGETEGKARAQLLASGVGVRWALEAQQLLAQDWDVAADVWSVTSWSRAQPGRRSDRTGQAARSGRGRRHALRHPGAGRRTRSGDRHQRFAACRAEPDRALGSRRLRRAWCRRFRVLRHQGGRPPAFPDRRPVDGGRHPVRIGTARRIPRRCGGRGGGEVRTARCPGRHLRQRRWGLLSRQSVRNRLITHRGDGATPLPPATVGRLHCPVPALAMSPHAPIDRELIGHSPGIHQRMTSISTGRDPAGDMNASRRYCSLVVALLLVSARHHTG